MFIILYFFGMWSCKMWDERKSFPAFSTVVGILIKTFGVWLINPNIAGARRMFSRHFVDIKKRRTDTKTASSSSCVEFLMKMKRSGLQAQIWLIIIIFRYTNFKRANIRIYPHVPALNSPLSRCLIGQAMRKQSPVQSLRVLGSGESGLYRERLRRPSRYGTFYFAVR